MASYKGRVLLVSIVPPQNDCGVRIVMHRHLVERNPFELQIATNYAETCNPELNVTRLELPYPLQRLRKSRFGPKFGKWVKDFENLVWPLVGCRALERAVDEFNPDVILTLAETGLCHIAAKIAKKRGIPLAVLFLDWFPIMDGHFGHRWTRDLLSRRYRRLYSACDLAICTSDGMREVLGPHPNSRVVYPMPGRHVIPLNTWPPPKGKFRLVYVGAAERFYGRMLRLLIKEMGKHEDLELIIVGPHGDWPDSETEAAKAKGITLGFLPPEKAAEVMAGADAVLVVMSFEKEHELFMRTSFTTKWLDYSVFGKPVILWGPPYCTPSRLATIEDAALVVEDPDPAGVVSAMRRLQQSHDAREKYSAASNRLNGGLFDPDRLQNVFVAGIGNIVRG